jgi:hypothetical protein
VLCIRKHVVQKAACVPFCRSDNQICEEFFQKFKAQIVKGGLKSLTTMLHETSKFIRFHSEHDRKELGFHMEPVITSELWSRRQVHHMYPMVMACALSVNPGKRAGGASQGRSNALSQESGSSQHEKSGKKLFTKNNLGDSIFDLSPRAGSNHSNAQQNCSTAKADDQVRTRCLHILAMSAC